MNQSLLFLFEFAVLITILVSVLLLTVAGPGYPKRLPMALVLLTAGLFLLVVVGVLLWREAFVNPIVANSVVIVFTSGVIVARVWEYRKHSSFQSASQPSGSTTAQWPYTVHDVHAIKVAYYDFAPVIFLSLDVEGRVVMINRHGCTVVSCNSPEIVSRNWFNDFVASTDREHDLRIFRECLETHEEKSFRSHIRDRHGLLRLIQWKSGFDNKTGLILYVGEDITDAEAQHLALTRSLKNVNKLKEKLEERVRIRTRDLETINIDLELQIEERKLIEDRLINSQRLYRAIAHNFPDGLIAVLDDHFRFLMIDGRELPVLGLSTDDMIGTSIFEGSDPLLNERSRGLMETVFTGRNITFEITRNSSIYSATAVPLYDQQEVVYAILLVMQNITERKNLEANLYKAIEQEKKLNDLKSRFVTMASHEFRTPLSTILSSLFLLESYTGALYDEKKYVHIGRIKRTVNMLTETLNDFMRLGRLEEGRVEMVLRKVDIPEYADDVRKEMQSAARPGQVIHYRHEGCRHDVLIDKNLLRSIFTNLLSNAIKYSPDGAEIVFETKLSPHELTINVVDQGIGIAPEEQEHIFQRFFRALNATNIEGTGLGLHIIKKYVEMMKGTINFASGDGGTTFTIKVPLQFSPDDSYLMLQ